MFTAAAIIGLMGIAIFAIGPPPMIAFPLCLAFFAVGSILPDTVLAAGALIVQGAHLGKLLGPLAARSGRAMVLALLLGR